MESTQDDNRPARRVADFPAAGDLGKNGGIVTMWVGVLTNEETQPLARGKPRGKHRSGRVKYLSLRLRKPKHKRTF